MDEIRRIGGTVNAIVVQLPERRQPGVVIQRDSIENLLALIQNARQQIQTNQWDEARDLIEEVDNLIAGYASVFER